MSENRVKILMGYTISDNTNVVFGEAKLITEVQTEGEDHNGYPRQETLGVCKNEFGDICLFRGSTDRATYDPCTAITMNQGDKKLSLSLYELAYKLHDEGL